MNNNSKHYRIALTNRKDRSKLCAQANPRSDKNKLGKVGAPTTAGMRRNRR